jgi:hypothetical protein
LKPYVDVIVVVRQGDADGSPASQYVRVVGVDPGGWSRS